MFPVIQTKEVQEELALDMKLLEQMLQETSNEAMLQLQKKVRKSFAFTSISTPTPPLAVYTCGHSAFTMYLFSLAPFMHHHVHTCSCIPMHVHVHSPSNHHAPPSYTRHFCIHIISPPTHPCTVSDPFMHPYPSIHASPPCSPLIPIQNTLKEEIQLYRSYLAEAEREERQREQELDSLLNAEVEQQWAKRMAQWRTEREARRKLMDDVMRTRRQQVQEKSEHLQV